VCNEGIRKEKEEKKEEDKKPWKTSSNRETTVG